MVNFLQKSTDHNGTKNILRPNSNQAVVDFRAIFFKKYIIIRQLNQKIYTFFGGRKITKLIKGCP